MIVGLTGTLFSAKNELAKHFYDAGYGLFSFGDVIRTYAHAHGIESPTIEQQQKLTKMRPKDPEREPWSLHLIDFMWQNGFEQSAGNYIVEGFSLTSQIDAFRKEFGDSFYLIGTDAPEKKRFLEFQEARDREGEPSDLETFQRVDGVDRFGHLYLDGRKLTDEELMQGVVGNGLEIEKCLSMADERIETNGSKEFLQRRAADVMGRYGRGSERVAYSRRFR